MTDALKEVSAGVAKDVQELKQSFQAAIRVDSDEEGEEAGSAAAATAQEGLRVEVEGASAGPTEEDLRTREVVDRLDAVEVEPDSGLEKSLKVRPGAAAPASLSLIAVVSVSHSCHCLLCT
jgi:hypothetical protein